MLGLLGSMFGSSKVTGKLIDTAAGALDKLVYTKQEQSEDARKASMQTMDCVLSWMNSSKGQNIARRFIAIIIVSVWVLQYLMAMGIDISIAWVDSEDIAERLRLTSEAIGARAEGMNGAMMLILGFYFAAPHLDKIAGAALQKFSTSKHT